MSFLNMLDARFSQDAGIVEREAPSPTKALAEVASDTFPCQVKSLAAATFATDRKATSGLFPFPSGTNLRGVVLAYRPDRLPYRHFKQPKAFLEATLYIMAWIDQTWWTEAHATWTGAVALVLIFVLDSVLAWFQLRENKEARNERRLADIDRQRSEVTLGELTSMLRSLNEEQLCTVLWASNFRHAGFAFEKDFYAQLPEYLRRKCDPIMEEIKKPVAPEAHQKARFLLVFRFPYPRFDAVLEDVSKLNLGSIHLVWDEDGKPIRLARN